VAKVRAEIASALRGLDARVGVDTAALTGGTKRGATEAQRALDSISTSKAQGELRLLGRASHGTLADLRHDLDSVRNGAAGTGTALVGIGAGTALLGSKVLKGLQPAIDAASALNEQISFSEQVFGSSAGQISDWGDTAAQSLGQSKRQAIEAANTFAIFGKAAGRSGGDLVRFSTDLTKLATDLASARDTSPEEAITAIGAALRGESEPIRRYGVLLDDAGNRQEALRLGLIKTTKDALTPQQRVLAVQSQLYRQTADSADNFAKTSDGVANSERIKAAAIEDANAKMGTPLQTVVAGASAAFTGLLNIVDRVPGGLEAVGVGIAALGGVTILGGVASTIFGARKAWRDYRIDARAAGVETELVGDKALIAGAKVETVGAAGSRSFGKLGSAAKVAGAVLAGLGIVETIAGIANELRGLDTASSDAMTAFSANIDKGRVDVLTSFNLMTDAIDARSGLGEAAKALFDTTDFQFAGVGEVRDLHIFQEALDKLRTTKPVDELRKFSEAARAQNEQLDHNSENYIETTKLLDDFDAKVATAAAAQDRATRSTEDNTAANQSAGDALDLLGNKIDTSAGKWASYADQLRGIFDPIQSALGAESGLEDANRQLEEARQRQADILAGRSDSLDSAREALASAKADLARERADVGAGSTAAADALERLQDAIRALHDAQVEAGKAPREGDFFEDNRAEIADRARDVLKAQRELDRIRSGKSDGVEAATKRVEEAQRRVNEEVKKTGANSKAAADAQRDVEAAERRVLDAALQVEAANARLRDEYEQHPEAIQKAIEKVDELVARGIINIETARQFKQELHDAVTASQSIVDTLARVAPPNLDALRPGAKLPGDTPATPKPSAPAPQARKPISFAEGAKIGLPPFPPSIPAGAPMPESRDSKGGKWKLDFAHRQWIPFADGGLLDRQLGHSGGFPTDPTIMATRPGGYVKAFESEAGPWEGFVSGAPEKRERSKAVTAEIADRLGMMLVDKKAQVSAFADGGFLGPQRTAPSFQAPTTSASSASGAAIVAELRSMRAELIANFRGAIRATAGAGATEPLAPVLHEIERNTRNMGPRASSSEHMAAMRASQAGFSR
jgi:uncharacterized protein YoaH (UPF0181 family)